MTLAPCPCPPPGRPSGVPPLRAGEPAGEWGSRGAVSKIKELKPPEGFVKSHSYHYGKYEKKKLISILSMSVMKMNNMPGSIAVSIDMAASTNKNHSITFALDSIKKLLCKRRNPCALFAQVAQKDVARAFWSGKLTKTAARVGPHRAVIDIRRARHNLRGHRRHGPLL